MSLETIIYLAQLEDLDSSYEKKTWAEKKRILFKSVTFKESRRVAAAVMLGGGGGGKGESHILDFISGSLSSTEVLAKRGAAGRGFGRVTRGAKSLNFWASAMRGSREAHHH